MGEPFVRGIQNDAEEAFRHLVDAWAAAEGTAQVCGRGGYAPLSVSRAHQLFSVVTECCTGCFAEVSPGVRCRKVLSRCDVELILRVTPPPLGRETRVRWQLENLGVPDIVADYRCQFCGQEGGCVRREYLARVGPLLMVQLGIYDFGTRRKLPDIRIHADERLTVRVGDAACELSLIHI